MTRIETHIIPLFLLMTILIGGCFPSKKAVPVEPESYEPGYKVKSPSKIFLIDSSLVIFNKGFTASDNHLEGTGTKYQFADTTGVENEYRIPFDSIATMTNYVEHQNDGSELGSAVLGLMGPGMLFASLYCMTCPKCCFGSCPTAYTTGGDDYTLEAELFSYNLSRFFQDEDFDRLAQKPKSDGSFPIRLTNEALETHYINQFELQAAYHPKNTEAYPTPDGKVAVVTSLKSPAKAIDSDGKDIKYSITNRDSSHFRGVFERFKEAESSRSRDWMDITLPVSKSDKTITLVLNLRNTLLSTVLFYDVVLASQGVKALEWNSRLNSDSLYAAFYRAAYRSFSGMEVKIKQQTYSDESAWKKVSEFGDLGPIAWTDLAIVLPVSRNKNGFMEVRLEWFPDNFMIDYVGYDMGNQKLASVHPVWPDSVVAYNGDHLINIKNTLEKMDSNYLIAEPGESNYFYYKVPKNEKLNTTLFIKSSGYYTEWLRGSWIGHENPDYTFNIFGPDEILSQLKESWLKDKEMMEETFFKTKIPLRENKR